MGAGRRCGVGTGGGELVRALRGGAWGVAGTARWRPGVRVQRYSCKGFGDALEMWSGCCAMASVQLRGWCNAAVVVTAVSLFYYTRAFAWHGGASIPTSSAAGTECRTKGSRTEERVRLHATTCSPSFLDAGFPSTIQSPSGSGMSGAHLPSAQKPYGTTVQPAGPTHHCHEATRDDLKPSYPSRAQLHIAIAAPLAGVPHAA